jgi:hypothetical protein
MVVVSLVVSLNEICISHRTWCKIATAKVKARWFHEMSINIVPSL